MTRIHSLDEPERLRGPFVGSLALHGGMVAAFIALTVLKPFGKVLNLGDPNGGRFGAVAVNAVASIPLPNKGLVPNPVANDTQSQVPQAPSKAKPQPKSKAPDLDAIALKGRNAKERKQAAKPNPWADKQQYRDNQLYSRYGSAASSPLYATPGGGGIGFGNNSPFGAQFGWYGDLLRGKIAAAWHPDFGSRAGAVMVQFTMRADGSLSGGLPRIVQTSGDANIDRSAQRAVLDAAPFPQLPPQLGRSEVNIELTFQLRR